MKENNELCKTTDDSSTATELATRPVATYKPHYTSRYDEESWEVSVSLPGVQKSDVSVTVESEILEISAARHSQIPEGWKPLGDYPSERHYRLRLDVGPEVDPAGISASLDHGVLTLRLPLKEEVKPVSIAIT